MEDLAWSIVTVLLVVAAFVVMVIGFPGAIGKRAKTRFLRRPPGPRDAQERPRPGTRDAP